MKRYANLLLTLCLISWHSGCNNQKAAVTSAPIRGGIDINTVLSWIPSDTETLLAANGPIWMSNFNVERPGEDSREITSEELEKYFDGLTLGLFGTGKGLLEKRLERKKILFALEGSRHFRPPAGLGEVPFEGAAVAIFEDNLSDIRDAFMKDAAIAALRIQEIEGQKIAVFQEPSERDVITTFVTFPQEGVVLIATNEKFLRDILVRMRGAMGERALPDGLPEWRFVNKRAQFWGLRHFDKAQSTEDPTSPFGGRKSANFPDDGAIGLTYECVWAKERKVMLTYLSSTSKIESIEHDRFPASSEPDATAGLNIRYHQPEPGVIQTTYDLSHSRSVDWFFFIFMASLGHAVYV
jgi:hypothetical protein